MNLDTHKLALALKEAGLEWPASTAITVAVRDNQLHLANLTQLEIQGARIMSEMSKLFAEQNEKLTDKIMASPNCIIALLGRGFGNSGNSTRRYRSLLPFLEIIHQTRNPPRRVFCYPKTPEHY